MPQAAITFEAPPWPDARDLHRAGSLVHVQPDEIGATMIPDGTVAGRPTVCLRFELPNGQTVVLETTLALLDGVVSACRGRVAYLEDLIASSKGDT